MKSSEQAGRQEPEAPQLSTMAVRGLWEQLRNTTHQALEALRQESSVKTRPARFEDIPAMVEIDLRGFRTYYKDDDRTKEEILAEQLINFTTRFDRVGSKWIEVIEIDKRVVGFTMGCPTSKPPEEFTSWEDTTDNGTLLSTYDQNGKYLYVVSLATLPEVTHLGVEDMLIGKMLSKIVEGNYEGYFEGRLPGLKKWVLGQCRQNGTRISSLTTEELDSYAEEYVTLTMELDGKTVRRDPLLRIYEGAGFDFVRVVRDAFQDGPSLNYGVVCVYRDPIIEFVRSNQLLHKMAGKGMAFIARSAFLTKKIT